MTWYEFFLALEIFLAVAVLIVGTQVWLGGGYE